MKNVRQNTQVKVSRIADDLSDLLPDMCLADNITPEEYVIVKEFIQQACELSNKLLKKPDYLI